MFFGFWPYAIFGVVSGGGRFLRCGALQKLRKAKGQRPKSMSQNTHTSVSFYIVT